MEVEDGKQTIMDKDGNLITDWDDYEGFEDSKCESPADEGADAMDMVEQLMALFCDMSDMGDHMEHHMDHGDMDHDDMEHDMDHGMDHDMDHDEWAGDHDMDDVNNRKDEHFCRRAKQMMRELHDYHQGDRHHK